MAISNNTFMMWAGLGVAGFNLFAAVINWSAGTIINLILIPINLICMAACLKISYYWYTRIKQEKSQEILDDIKTRNN